MLRGRQLCAGQKRGSFVGKTKRGLGTKIMAIGDARGLPVAISIESASPHEVTLVDGRITKRFVKEKPDHLVGDLAYDSDPLDAENEEEARHRGDRSSQRKPHKTSDPGRAGAASLQATLENREVLGLATELPPPCHPLRTPQRELSGLYSPSLRHYPSQKPSHKCLSRIRMQPSSVLVNIAGTNVPFYPIFFKAAFASSTVPTASVMVE